MMILKVKLKNSNQVTIDEMKGKFPIHRPTNTKFDASQIEWHKEVNWVLIYSSNGYSLMIVSVEDL